LANNKYKFFLKKWALIYKLAKLLDLLEE